MEMENLPFFVYGTLRTGENNWERFLKGRTSQEIPAKLPDHKMFIDEFPFVTDAEDGSQVNGDLVYPRPELYEAVTRDLDGLEQYDPTTGSGWYMRVVRDAVVRDEAGQPRKVRAWVYHGGPGILNDLDEKNLELSGDWLVYLGRENG
jgi:gamma-glutamylcyclotransferase (GGCT)/AIG2-like uncharacterized protein YtfP